MILFGLIVGYLVVGVLAGSLTSRLGYVLDGDVRKAEARLAEAVTEYEGRTTDSSYAQNRLYNVKQDVSKEFDKQRSYWYSAGLATVVLWPAVIALVVLGGAGWLLNRAVNRALRLALHPAKYDSHSEYLKELGP